MTDGTFFSVYLPNITQSGICIALSRLVCVMYVCMSGKDKGYYPWDIVGQPSAARTAIHNSTLIVIRAPKVKDVNCSSQKHERLQDNNWWRFMYGRWLAEYFTSIIYIVAVSSQTITALNTPRVEGVSIISYNTQTIYIYVCIYIYSMSLHRYIHMYIETNIMSGTKVPNRR